MSKSWVSTLRVAAAIAALSAYSHVSLAADHRDGAAVKMDAATDINDVFAWTGDGKVYLAMTVFPVADTMSKFSNAAKYVFHINSSAGYGMAATETLLICTFDAAQMISCWLTKDGTTLEYMTGDASQTAGLESESKKIKVFAGLRDDPFFFNLAGFNDAAELVSFAKGTLLAGADAAGCPMLDMGTADTVVTQLRTAPDGTAAQDFFRTLNTLAIVVSIDPSLVNAGGPLLGVWASTHR